MMPPAVMASDVAIRTIVRFAVRTFGSRMICTPFETASMPVYVPPPSEYARTKSIKAPNVPSEVIVCPKFMLVACATVADLAEVSEDRQHEERRRA